MLPLVPLNLSVRRREILFALGILFVYVLLASALAVTRLPYSDDGDFAEPAARLSAGKSFAMPMEREWLPGLTRHVYCNMPLYFLTLAVWFKLFGVYFATMGILSVFWGVLTLAAWYVIIRISCKEALVAVLGLALLALNYDFINLTTARYDAMTNGLSTLGLAAYILLRNRSLLLAAVISNVFLAAACMTHPYAIFGIAGLLVLAMTADRESLSWRHLFAAFVPYLFALTLWGWYISRDFSDFYAQISSGARGRMARSFNPLWLVYDEVTRRYLQNFGGLRSGVPVVMRLKLAVLAAYLAGFAGCLASRRVMGNRVSRAIVFSTGISFFLLALLDGNRWYTYLIYLVPLYAVVLALCLRGLFDGDVWGRRAALAVAAALALFSIAGVIYRVRLDTYHKTYEPAARFLQDRVRNNDLVLAPGEFGFALGFGDHVIEDRSFGYRTGRLPAYIVLGQYYRDLIERSKTDDPAVFSYVTNTLRCGYSLVFQSDGGESAYQVYARNMSVPPGSCNGVPRPLRGAGLQPVAGVR